MQGLAAVCIEYDGELAGPGAPPDALRRAEFALGRLCAAQALRQLGASEVTVGRGDGGAPQWPAGFTGSITHTQGFVAAVAAEAEDGWTVGLDAERLGAVPEEIWPLTFTPEEIAGLRSAEDQALAATRLFTAKEAYFKCRLPASGRRPAFKAVSVTLGDGSFHVSDERSGVTGRTLVRGETVVAMARGKA